MTRRSSRRDILAFAAAGLVWGRFTEALAGVLDRRRIAFLIGNEGSGGYEAYARLFAKHLALALPQSRMTVEVVQTADGRLAAKQIFEAPAGDLTIGLFEAALLYAEILDEEDVKFNLGAFNWLGKLAVDERVVVASKLSGINSIADLANRSEPAVYPASTSASRASFECYVLNDILGLSIKPVPGYNGGQRALAMISGEGQIVVGSYGSVRRLVEEEGAAVILRMNAVPNPGAPVSAPLLRDIAPKPVSKLADLMELSGNLGRWIAAPPNADAADVDALRTAFDAAVHDEAFLAEAAQLKIPIDPLSGSEVQGLVGALLADKAALQADLQAAIACGRRRAVGDRTC
ncbi:MAG: hypothetical protein WD036_12000 [Bauldia sp.]